MSKPRYGWGWIDGEDEEDGNRWIEIATLDADGCLDEEVAVLMIRNFHESVVRWPSLVGKKEAMADLIVKLLNQHATQAG